MRSTRSIVGAAVAALALLVTACGGSPQPASVERGPIVVGSFNFTESVTLANIYGKALADKGYKVSYRLNLGRREIVAPALEKGEIDFYPGYAATDLEYYNSKAGEASGDAQATTAKLRQRLEPKGIKVLEASPAVDQNAIVVTKATASRLNLKKVSDLTPVAGQLIFGTTAECDKRPFCLPGLDRVYGIKFKDSKVLETTAIRAAALEKGDVQVALLFSTDGVIPAKGFVALDDDKHLQLADNVVPILRAKVATDEVTQLLNNISSKLTTDALVNMNKRTDVDKDDPDVVAKKWLQDNGFVK